MKNLNTVIGGLPTFCGRLLTLVIAFGMLAFTQKVQGQILYKTTEGTQIKVSGTSNLHDWNMVSKSFTCEGNFILKGETLQEVNSLSFSLPVTNLKSKDNLMDTRAYKTLKAEQFNKITFKLLQATVVPQQKIINAVGNLSIAGVTNKIMLQTSYTINADKTITCKGMKLIKMSDYKIKAPSFMLGALKTGNELSIDLLLKFKNSNINVTNTK